MDPKQKIQRPRLPEVLLISGSGRNCGKTTLACRLISYISSQSKISALKISPHFHQMNGDQHLLVDDDNFRIYREMDSTTSKDSSRMLRAGASASFYLQCEDRYLKEAWTHLNSLLPKDHPVVCESGSLGRYFQPGLHLLVEGNQPDRMKRSYRENRKRADLIVRFDGSEFDLQLTDISLKNKIWTLKIADHDQVGRRA